MSAIATFQYISDYFTDIFNTIYITMHIEHTWTFPSSPFEHFFWLYVRLNSSFKYISYLEVTFSIRSPKRWNAVVTMQSAL
jgi:hypothetical protein